MLVTMEMIFTGLSRLKYDSSLGCRLGAGTYVELRAFFLLPVSVACSTYLFRALSLTIVPARWPRPSMESCNAVR